MISDRPESTDTAIKCLSCNAATWETTEGTFVCVDCANVIASPIGSTPSASSSSDEAEEIAADVGPRSDVMPVPRPRIGTDGGLETGARISDPAHGSPGLDGDLRLPAIGLVVSDGWSDHCLRSVIRARRRGHIVFLTYLGPADSEFLEAVELLGATVLQPEADWGETECVEAIERASRGSSLPGVIVQTDVAAPIDYDRSLQAVEDEPYVVDAVVDDRAFGVQKLDVLAAIPAHNEAGTIGDVVRTAKSHADEVIVIDDGSTDDTAELAEAAGAEVIRHERNAGYGAAIKTAFRVAADRPVENLVILDGDAQHDAADIPRVVEPLTNGEANIVIGSRLVEGSDSSLPRYRRFGIRFISVLMNLSTGNLRLSRFINDTQSGYRAYDRSALEALAEEPAISDDMDASVDILYHAHDRGYTVTEVGTTVRYDVENPSSQHPVVHGYRVVRSIVGTVERDRPITSLALPGLLSLSSGVGLWYSALLNSPTTLSPWLAIASVLLLVIGFSGCVAAAVLHAFNLNRDKLG